MTDLALHPQSHDLATRKTPGGLDFDIVEDAKEAAQRIKIRLKTLLTEWFLDETVGMPYFQEILRKSPNMRLLQSVYRQEIMAVDGILSVPVLVMEIEQTTRGLRVDFQCDTIWGAIEGTLDSPLLSNRG